MLYLVEAHASMERETRSTPRRPRADDGQWRHERPRWKASSVGHGRDVPDNRCARPVSLQIVPASWQWTGWQWMWVPGHWWTG
jgi:hypothetical protein